MEVEALAPAKDGLPPCREGAGWRVDAEGNTLIKEGERDPLWGLCLGIWERD